MDNYLDSIFEDDLLFVSRKVSDALNIFEETVVADNKLVTLYGNDEFIALFITPDKENPKLGSLRLRTRDMAASWKNVPVGFSQINESKGLLYAMKKASHVSLKRNSIWYIDRQLKDVVGDRIVFTEIKTNKGYLYKISFINGYAVNLTIAKDDREYNKGHDVALLYMLSDKNKNPIGPPMTADECILMLINIAMQPDAKTAKFVSIAERYGGKTLISHSYRTHIDSVDEVKAVFKNGYAMKLRIENEAIGVEAFGQYDGKTYLLDKKIFDNIDNVYEAVKEFANFPNYVPNESDSN